MNIKELKERISDLPDDMEVALSEYMYIPEDMPEINENIESEENDVTAVVYDIPIIGFGIDYNANDLRFIVATSSTKALEELESKTHKIEKI